MIKSALIAFSTALLLTGCTSSSEDQAASHEKDHAEVTALTPSNAFTVNELNELISYDIALVGKRGSNIPDYQWRLRTEDGNDLAFFRTYDACERARRIVKRKYPLAAANCKPVD